MILDSIIEKPPKRILFWKIDTNLNRMKFMQRNRLMEKINNGDLFYSIYSELTNVPKFILNFTSIKKTYPFVKIVIEDLKRRNLRDEKLTVNYTQNEINAGVKKINNGIFGIVDSIVRRYSGAYLHKEVENWDDNVIYMILKMDIDFSNYQRNLKP
jgi:hypothetical protein